MDYLAGLNEPQRAAVENINGPVMIIAGAGSGKTRVLTYRIAHMLRMGVDSFNILSLTFTNKSAAEMRKRIVDIAGQAGKNLWMGTFHSVFAKLLRIEADKINYPHNFTIYDTDDSRSLIKAIIKEKGLAVDSTYKPAIVHNRISSAKNGLIGPEEYKNSLEYQEADALAGRPKLGDIYETYQKRCQKAGAMDFDDLLFKTYLLLKNNPDTLYKYQHKFKYILVDEYQDTNHAQYSILKLLAAINENICVVGDDAQSIYSFRGASILNILNFEKDYPDCKTFKLEQNYRSTQTIVNAAAAIIEKNKQQLPKKIWTDNQLGEKIKVFRAQSDNDEGRLIASSIFEEKMKNQIHNKDFAILYRTNAQSRSMEEALRKMNIPYRIYGGLSFYQRKEIKDVIAYLRLVVNPSDEEAFKRVINYPTRGIGTKSIEKLIVLAEDYGLTLWEAAEKAPQIGFGSGASRFVDFTTMIKSFQALQHTENAHDLTRKVIKHTGISQELYSDKTVEGVSRQQNLEELLNGIKEFTENKEAEDVSLGTFLQDVSLMTNADKDDGNADKVTMMTIHAAKGLEFPYVYVVGLEENLFPSMQASSTREDLEEERRLFYVAMTRAEKRLQLSFASSRFKNGVLNQSEPSRFLFEIGGDFLKMDSGKQQPLHKVGYDDETMIGANMSRNSRLQSTQRALQQRKPMPISPQEAKNFVPDDFKSFKTGMFVEHQRFGIGKITLMEGNYPDLKAHIDFKEFGEKQLILKFARLKIHQTGS